MKVLIVGGTRFIGAHVVKLLHDAGAQITAFHQGISANPILPKIDHVLDPAARYPITAFPTELRRDWDIVIHMVAMGETDAAARTFAERTSRLVLVSSCDVYRAYGRLMKTEAGQPAFGFNPITQGRRRTLRGKPPPAGEAVSRGRSWSPRQAHDEVGLSVCFDGQTDQCRETRIIRLARYCMPLRKQSSGYTGHASTGQGQTKPRPQTPCWHHTN